jgi:hypothetical protein
MVKTSQINSNEFEFKTNPFKLHLIQDLPELKKIEIKYGFEVCDERNNFPYRNILRF